MAQLVGKLAQLEAELSQIRRQVAKLGEVAQLEKRCPIGMRDCSINRKVGSIGS